MVHNELGTTYIVNILHNSLQVPLIQQSKEKYNEKESKEDGGSSRLDGLLVFP